MVRDTHFTVTLPHPIPKKFGVQPSSTHKALRLFEGIRTGARCYQGKFGWVKPLPKIISDDGSLVGGLNPSEKYESNLRISPSRGENTNLVQNLRATKTNKHRLDVCV